VVETIEPPDADGFIRANVVGSAPGPTTLRVRAAVDDGSQMSATFAVSFFTATGLHVTCDHADAGDQLLLPPFGQCGGLHPVFTNSSWRWIVMFDSDSGPLWVFNPSITLEGTGVTFDATTGWLQSGAQSGTAQVTIASRQFTKIIPIRVVSLTDVASAELRLVTPTDGIDQELTQVGPAPSTLWYPTQNGLRFAGDTGTAEIMPLLTLADGSQVYGGAGLFSTDHPEVCTVTALPAGANLVQQTEVQPDCRAVGSVTFVATVGPTSITWPVMVAAPPAAH
jgi:hypothetical protein